MKKGLIWIALMVGLFSCEDETPTAPVDDTFDTTKATLSQSGMFMNSAHAVTGTASHYVLDGKDYITLDPFMTENGPDLKVYLSINTSANPFVRLGELKSINGKQTYEVPPGTDLSSYKFVLVWCEKFSVNFGYAELK